MTFERAELEAMHHGLIRDVARNQGIRTGRMSRKELVNAILSLALEDLPVDDADARYMGRAIRYAEYAQSTGRAPYGCVIVNEDGIELGRGLGSGTKRDPISHSELHAIREASANHGGLLRGCTLYSTHEPCSMCCGAITHAKLSRVVYGSARADLRHLYREYDRSVHERLDDTSEPPDVLGGVLRDACIRLLDPANREDA